MIWFLKCSAKIPAISEPAIPEKAHIAMTVTEFFSLNDWSIRYGFKLKLIPVSIKLAILKAITIATHKSNLSNFN